MFFNVGVLENFAIFTGKHLYWSLFLIKLQACNFVKKTPTQVFSCPYCEIFRTSFFYRTPPVAASDISRYETSIVQLRKQRKKERLNINNSCQKNSPH